MMFRVKLPAAVLIALAGLSSRAAAQSAPADPWVESAEPTAETAVSVAAADAPIPPNVEGPAVQYQNNGYCYVGPHPVDPRTSNGATWDGTQGQHVHYEPPLDLRLFAYQNGCYYFTGDPRDFGFQGQTYSYYGAHPILAAYGGGWCFMVGPHYHVWRPWSPYFTMVGPWYYWYGPYDAFFWAYWPYYSFYYRSYYPRFYAGGRFYTNRSYTVAPPIRSVPSSVTAGWRGIPPSAAARNAWRGTPPSAGGPAAGAWRGTPPGAAPGGPAAPGARGFAAPSAGAWRGAPPAAGGVAPAPGGAWRGTPPAAGGVAPAPGASGFSGAQVPSYSGGWRATPPAPSGGFHPTPSPAPSFGGGFRAMPPAGGGFHPSPAPSFGGGFRASPPSGGGFHPAPSFGGGFHAPSGGGFHAPSGGGFHAPSGGGFRGGGAFRGRH